MRRKAILLRVLALTAGKRDFDKHLFDSYKHDPRPAEPGRIVRVCPTRLSFQNIPDRLGDSGYNVNGKRRTPRKCSKARAA